jgi:hypothetical protein
MAEHYAFNRPFSQLGRKVVLKIEKPHILFVLAVNVTISQPTTSAAACMQGQKPSLAGDEAIFATYEHQCVACLDRVANQAMPLCALGLWQKSCNFWFVQQVIVTGHGPDCACSLTRRSAPGQARTYRC